MKTVYSVIDIFSELSKLNHVLSDHGWMSAKLNTEPPTQAGPDTWCTTVKVKVTGAQQLPVSEANKSKKEAEQLLAKLVLSNLSSVPEGNASAKAKLHSYCGSKKFTLPEYEMVQTRGDKLYRSILITSCLGDCSDIEIIGDEASSEDLAADSAIRKAVVFIKKLPFPLVEKIKAESSPNPDVISEKGPDVHVPKVKGHHNIAVTKSSTNLQSKGKSWVTVSMAMACYSCQSVCRYLYFSKDW